VAGTQTAPRLLGLGRGIDVVVAARWLDASTARRWGIAMKVVPSQRLRSEALRYARRLARLPLAAVAALKRAVNEGLDRSLAEGLELEKRGGGKLQPVWRTAEIR
jgi:enoyl-CoA hydratase/carnithine racemase